MVGGDLGKYEYEESVNSIVISPAERYIIEVKFDSLCGTFIMEWHENGFWLNYGDGQFELPNKKFREVIGNIYENPELLK